jgi:hypothetical protein
VVPGQEKMAVTQEGDGRPMPRISDVVTGRMEAAVRALPVLQAVRDAVLWDALPSAVMTRGPGSASVGFFLMVGVRVPGTADDWALVIARDPFDPSSPQAAYDAAVRELYAQADAEAHS